MEQILSKAELARKLKLSRARVSQLSREGLPVLASGKVELQAALNWISSHVDRSRNVGRAPGSAHAPIPAQFAATPNPPMQADAGRALLIARAKKTLAEARRAERLERHQAGELVERTEAAAYAANFSMLVRDHVLIQPDRLAERLAATNDRAEVYRILRDDGRALLVRLSKAIFDADLGKQTEAGR